MPPKYEHIENALSGMQSSFTPEDCHGMLCAMLIANNSLPCNRWLDEIYTPAPINPAAISQDKDALTALYNHMHQGLNDSLLNFFLLIRDYGSLSGRVKALKNGVMDSCLDSHWPG